MAFRSGRSSLREGWLVVLTAVVALLFAAAGPMDVARAQRRPTTTTTRSTTTTMPTSTTTSKPPMALCGGEVLPKASGGVWQCTLSEEFDGTTLNRSLWDPITTAENGFHSGPECFVDTPNNVSVADGVLSLTVRKEAQPFICKSPQGDYATQYTSEQIATYGTFAQAYGRYQVRAKVPGTQVPGLQTSFWLWPQDQTKYGPWPYSGEIDIAEMYSAFNDRAIPFVHYNNWQDPYVTNNYCIVGDLAQFHTYTLEWTPQTLTFIYDGQTCLVDNWNPMDPQVKPQPFDQPFFVALTQLLGVSNNAFQPDRTPLPASTQVDYVRVWQ